MNFFKQKFPKNQVKHIGQMQNIKFYLRLVLFGGESVDGMPGGQKQDGGGGAHSKDLLCVV